MPELRDAVALAAFDHVRRSGRDAVAALSLEQRRASVDQAWETARAESARVGVPFSCRGAGCWGCCRGEVVVSREELTDLLPRLGPEVSRRALAAQNADRREAICPVLDPATGKCTAWEARPLMCRAYNAVTPADWCFPERSGLRDVASAVGPLGVVGGFCLVDGERSLPWGTLFDAIVDAAKESE